MIRFPPTLPLVSPLTAETSEAIRNSFRFWALRWLGNKWLLHPENQVKRKTAK